MTERLSLERRSTRLAMPGLLITILALVIAVAATTQAADGQSEPEAELAERFAPILMLRPQSEPCDPSGERWAPAPADIVLDNPQMLLRQVGVGNPVVKVGPSASDIFGLGEGFYIDFPGDGFKPGCIYEEDFQRYNDGRNAVVYAHIATQADEPDKLAIQYWFFWYYNKYNNLHEGDWEGIQLMFDVGTVAEALQTEPSSIGLSQHFGGEIATWGKSPDPKLKLIDTHPVLYPAVGSHATYFSPSLYLGRSGSQGFGCDDAQKASKRLEPDVVLLPHEVNDPDDPLAWMMFEGIWGEQRFGAFSGPTGPITKARWTEPVEWHNTLRNSSVEVPSGRDSTTPYIGTFCTVVGFGSRQFLTSQQNPFRTTLIVGALALALAFVISRTDWKPVPALPVIRRRRMGEMLSTSGTFYWRHWKLFTGLGATSILLAVANGLVVLSVAFALTPFGLFGTLLAGLLALLGEAALLAAVSAATAHATDTLERGQAATVRGSYRAAIGRLHVLLGALFRIFFIVAGLAITIVGIPWAIRQYIRYQFATQVIMFEGLNDSKAALQRSSSLVAGWRRWIHTATVIVFVRGLIALGSAMLGLSLLILANGLPLWLYTMAVTATAALVLPYSALTVIMLYGNAKAATAEQLEAKEAETVSNSTTGSTTGSLTD